MAFTSKSVAGQRPSAYMLRRQNAPGPMLGLYAAYTFGPTDIAGADSTRKVSQRLIGPLTSSTTAQFQSGSYLQGSGGRIEAISWFCTDVSGAGAALDFRYHSGPSSVAGGQSLLNAASIDLNATPSGVIYVNDTASTYYLTRTVQSVTGIGSDPSIAVASGGGLWFQVRITGGTATAKNLCVVVWITPDSHINANPAND